MKTITINHVNFEIQEKQTCGFCGESPKACVVGKVPIQFTERARPDTELRWMQDGMFGRRELVRIQKDCWDDPKLRVAGFSTICVDCLRQMGKQANDGGGCLGRCCPSPIEKMYGGGVVGAKNENT